MFASAGLFPNPFVRSLVRHIGHSRQHAMCVMMVMVPMLNSVTH